VVPSKVPTGSIGVPAGGGSGSATSYFPSKTIDFLAAFAA